jgi:predicted KAP-like P-loop ATPase
LDTSHSNKYDKQKILENIILHIDEPNTKSNLFGTKNLSEKLGKFLLGNTSSTAIPTPYTIAIHVQWGGGKTSLIKRTFDIIEKELDKDKTKKKKFKNNWFDAWEYEQLDVVAALLQIIGKAYNNKGSDFKKSAAGVGLTFLDLGLKVILKTSVKDIDELYTKYIDSSVEVINSFKQKLEDIIGRDGRLIVFVDDLDRCDVENILQMLSAIKLLFNAKGVIS